MRVILPALLPGIPSVLGMGLSTPLRATLRLTMDGDIRIFLSETEIAGVCESAEAWKHAIEKAKHMPDPWAEFHLEEFKMENATRYRKKLSNFLHMQNWKGAFNYVAKRYIETVDREVYFEDAFSHFTFERSGHQLIIVDIQGVGDLYTDPQIHTESGTDFGDGNLDWPVFNEVDNLVHRDHEGLDNQRDSENGGDSGCPSEKRSDHEDMDHREKGYPNCNRRHESDEDSLGSSARK
ncbi:putative Eukaryotic elongation factor 2 kinase protein [Naja naja]|nr:putative Eukaryotic elongation factor 2 kinase protein [Naja naja]